MKKLRRKKCDVYNSHEPKICNDCPIMNIGVFLYNLVNGLTFRFGFNNPVNYNDNEL